MYLCDGWCWFVSVLGGVWGWGRVGVGVMGVRVGGAKQW